MSSNATQDTKRSIEEFHWEHTGTLLGSKLKALQELKTKLEREECFKHIYNLDHQDLFKKQ